MAESLIARLYKESFRVRFFDAEPTGRATPAALCRFSQESADGHCRQFGMSLLEVRAQSRMWVLTRLRLKVERYPRLGDEVTVETWASTRTDGLRAFRDFRFSDAKGDTLGHAHSIWLLLDVERKRPIRLPQVILDICNPDLSTGTEFEIPRLKPPQHPTIQRFFEVGWKELDGNNHTNNVSYVEWALEALPLEMRRDRMLAQLDMEFLAEALYGNRITSQVEVTDDVCVHQLRNAEGTVLSLAVTRSI